ncbi:hypothetical protein [Desulfofalx alkaliphila]|uniref:hypothetical protein n=1 Tax=Desulfofalx alkaliphila TaxID=105483 RepID=UPI000AC663C8|nr:hypothetical protein [Desulfofalx alkaliphila]
MLSELEKMLPEGERQMAGISLTETALIEKAVHHYYLKYEQSKQDKQSLVKLMIS